MRKPKLIARFRHGHLIPKVGFRVDLREDGNEWGSMDKSICFEVLEASKEKIKIRLYHVGYDKNVGEHYEDSWGLYEIGLNIPYKENNINYLGNEYAKK